MIDQLNKKDEFILELRNHLKKLYNTKFDYTFGESDSEGHKINGAYCLVRSAPNKPRQINGFLFRRNNCFSPITPKNKCKLLEDVCNFISSKNEKSILEKNEESLTVEIEDQKYLVTAYVDPLYEGQISVYFSKYPFSEKDFSNNINT